MARVDGKFLRGVLGAFVYRVVNGRQIVSVKADKLGKKVQVPKTPPNNFGLASRLGAPIRRALSSEPINRIDATMNTRLISALMVILKRCRDPESLLFRFEEDSFSVLKGLEFNLNSKTTKWIDGPPYINLNEGVITVSFSDMITFPPNVFFCTVTVSVLLIRLKDGYWADQPEQQKAEIKNSPRIKETLHEFRFKVPDGCLCITSMFLTFFEPGGKDRGLISIPKYKPGFICDAYITPGTYSIEKNRHWESMVKFDQI